jgi:hypothetical protein
MDTSEGGSGGKKSNPTASIYYNDTLKPKQIL